MMKNHHCCNNNFVKLKGILYIYTRYNSDTEVVTFNAEILKNETSIKDFEMIKPLGQGAFGGVILAKKKTSKDLYAIKIIDCSN